MVLGGIVAGVVYFLFRAIARIAGHAASLFSAPAPEPERVEPARVEPELTRRLPVKGPHAMV